MSTYKYITIKNVILDKIASGELLESMPIPSERDLSKIYDCSRMTVRQAISELVSSGVLYKIQGKGTFVSTNKYSQNSVMSFTKAISANGNTPNTIIESFVSKNIIDEPNLNFEFENKRYYVSKRIRFADQTPIAVETVYIPFDNCPNLKKEMLKGSLHSLLRDKYDLNPVRGDFNISARLANDSDVKFLKIPKVSAVLEIVSQYYCAKGKLIYIENAVYRGDMYEYKIKK